MTFEETISKIDKEIYRLNERGKRIWFDVGVEVNGYLNQIENYYKKMGYSIEIHQCKGCQNKKADILICW